MPGALNLDKRPPLLNNTCMNAVDFDIESLARHLQLSPDQVLRMVERGKLPGRRIGGQWRFAAADIHHWWEEHIGGLSDAGQLAAVEVTLETHPAEIDDPKPFLRDLLSIDAIAVPLPARTRGSVIAEMIALGVRSGHVWDPERLAEAVRSRESLHPTALDNGVALLHPRRPLSTVVAEPFLALGRTAQGVPFGHPRGVLTDLFFLIGATDDRSHLRILARLSRVLAAETLLDRLRTAESPRETWEILVECEAEFPA